MSNPCLNNGKCEQKDNSYTCTCTDFYTGKNCQHSGGIIAGIVIGSFLALLLLCLLIVLCCYCCCRGGFWLYGSKSKKKLREKNETIEQSNAVCLDQNQIVDKIVKKTITDCSKQLASNDDIVIDIYTYDHKLPCSKQEIFCNNQLVSPKIGYQDNFENYHEHYSSNANNLNDTYLTSMNTVEHIHRDDIVVTHSNENQLCSNINDRIEKRKSFKINNSNDSTYDINCHF